MRPNVQRYQRPVGERVSRLEGDGFFQIFLRIGQPARRQVEVAERQIGSCRLRREENGVLERLFGVDDVSPLQLQGAQLRVRSGLGGVKGNGLLNFLDRRPDVFETGAGAAEQELRIDIPDVAANDRARSSPGLLISADRAHVGLSQSQPRLAKPGVLLDRLPILDDGFAVLLFVGEPVRGFQGRIRAAGAARGQHGGQRERDS